jgi:DNA-binding XRE family transcriptional regulator
MFRTMPPCGVVVNSATRQIDRHGALWTFGSSRCYKRNMTLKEYIKEYGVTQAEIARQAGVTRAQVCRWLKGDHSPNLKAVVALAKATKNKVSVDDWRRR